MSAENHSAHQQPALLVVDDDLLVVSTLKMHLRRILPQEWLLITALSGPEALGLVEEHVKDGGAVHVALVDYQMFPMRGTELLMKLNERYPSMRTIMLTGQADMEAVNLVIDKVKLFRYMQKPWDPRDLERTVLESITGAGQGQEEH